MYYCVVELVEKDLIILAGVCSVEGHTPRVRTPFEAASAHLCVPVIVEVPMCRPEFGVGEAEKEVVAFRGFSPKNEKLFMNRSNTFVYTVCYSFFLGVTYGQHLSWTSVNPALSPLMSGIA